MPMPSDTTTSESFQLGVTLAYVLIVVVSWGMNYPLMKLALRDVSPLTFTAVRVLGGAVCVACLLWALKAPRLFPPADELGPLAGISLLQYGCVLGLTSIALLWLPAGRTITAIYTMPLWAVIFDVLILRVRLRPFQIFGMFVSLVGILLFMDPSVLDWSDSGTVVGMALTLTAAVAWGLGAVLYRTRTWTASFWSQSFWQLLCSGSVLAVAALIFEFPASVDYTMTLILIVLWNWIVPTAVGVWAWSRVLHRLPASIAGQLLMCTPFIGIGISAWMFQEDLPPVFAISAVLIAIGGAMVLIRRKT